MDIKTWPFKPLDFSKYGGLSQYHYRAEAMLRAGAEWGNCEHCNNVIPVYHDPRRGYGTVCLICGKIIKKEEDYFPRRS